jgi:UDP-glucose 4-epimerase
MVFLITGGSGCIGSYVIRDLLGRGERVINFDADPGIQILEQVVPRDALAGLSQVRGDITDQFHLARVIRQEKVRKVIHLASLQIPASNANPPLAEQVVVGGLVNVLEIARLMELEAVVWASSIAVFGPPEEYGNVPVLNGAHHRPQSVYGACKSLGEYLVHYYHREYNVNALGFRFTAVYGVGRERGRSSFTTEMIRKAAAGESYVIPFGDDVIDWQYVEDVSRLILTAADAQELRTRVFNTRGDCRPVKDGMNYLKKLAPKAELTLEPGRFGIAWNCDTTPLEEELGFRPTYSMEAGILRTFNLYRIAAGLPPASQEPESPGTSSVRHNIQ